MTELARALRRLGLSGLGPDVEQRGERVGSMLRAGGAFSYWHF